MSTEKDVAFSEAVLPDGMTVIYTESVRWPSNRKGVVGEVKVVGDSISMFSAMKLLKTGQVRLVCPMQRICKKFL